MCRASVVSAYFATVGLGDVGSMNGDAEAIIGERTSLGANVMLGSSHLWTTMKTGCYASDMLRPQIVAI